MSEFGRLAATPCEDHAALGALLARELGSPDDAVDDRLEALAARLPAAAGAMTMLGALGALLAEELAPDPGAPLLLPDALAARRGHPVAVALAGAGIARHAGLPIGLVGHSRRLYLADEDAGGPLVVDTADPARLTDASRLGRDLQWRCAHETACIALAFAAERAERHLDLPTAIGCAALRMLLPLTDADRAAAEAEHRRLLARLN
jgi:hypothetical protein